MPSHPANPAPFDASALAALACPACRCDLRPEDTRLVCGACGRAYPVVDGIPVLIPARVAAPVGSSAQSHRA